MVKSVEFDDSTDMINLNDASDKKSKAVFILGIVFFIGLALYVTNELGVLHF